MANAMDSFYQSYALGQDIGSNISKARETKRRNEYANRLAEPLKEGDYQGAADVAFEEGDIGGGMQFQEKVRALAAADKKAAMEKGEQFMKGHQYVSDVLARVDAAKARGIITTEEQEMAALQQGMAGIAPLLEQDPELAESVSNLVMAYQQSPTGAAMIYNEELMKQELGATDPKSLREESRDDARLGFEERRVRVLEREAERKANEKDELGGLTENQVIQVAKSFGTDFEQAAKGSISIVRDPKINAVMNKPPEQIVNNPTETGQLRYALARLANGGGVLSVQDVTMADGSSLYDNIVGQANQIAGKGKMSERQARRGLELLRANYEAEQAYLNDLISAQQEQAGIAGVPDKYMGLVTPGASSLQNRMGGRQVGPVQIQSDEEYNSLPSGATFIAPDGTVRQKP